MLNIRIAERFRPFSHTPGIKIPLPFSDWAVTIYPTKLHFYSMNSPEHFEVGIDLESMPDRFTAVCDLERGGIQVEMRVQEKLVRYWIFENNGPVLFREKGTLKITSDRVKVVDQFSKPSRFTSERLSFGVTKKQDWDLVCRRADVREFVPIWFRLGNKGAQLVVPTEEQLKEQFLGCFSGLMVPDLKLPELMGLQPPQAPICSCSIRALFFRESEAGILEILPNLPSCFPEGRFTGIQFSLGTVDLEWTKGRIRKMIVHAEKQGSVRLQFPEKNISYRLRSTGEPSLDFQAGSGYFLDQFLCR